MSKSNNILDHIAYVCDCGCVTFYLLKSGKIECERCGVMQEKWRLPSPLVNPVSKGSEMKTGAKLIAEERTRQVEKENWSAMHDDDHDRGCLAMAGECYVKHYRQRNHMFDLSPMNYQSEPVPDEWPADWSDESWKPKSPIRDLVRAGALIAAEIDRLQRQP